MKGVGLITNWIQAIFDFIFPPLCFGCDKEITRKQSPDSNLLCPKCFIALYTSGLGVCFHCGFPRFPGKNPHHCKKDFRLKRVRALGFFSPPFSPLIHHLKYHSKERIANILGDGLAWLLSNDGLLKRADFLIPVPLHPSRVRERGFNQSELLAQRVAVTAKIPLIQPLVRKKNTKPQTRLTTEARIENMRDAFSLKNNYSLSQFTGKKGILVDDVMTTGATFNSCAQVLLNAGIKEVYGLVVAAAQL